MNDPGTWQVSWDKRTAGDFRWKDRKNPPIRQKIESRVLTKTFRFAYLKKESINPTIWLT
jgi:hypothetical protein